MIPEDADREALGGAVGDLLRAFVPGALPTHARADSAEASERRRAISLKRGLVIHQSWIAALQVALALVAGMKTQYFDKPFFGSWFDYFAIFAWAFGATVILEALFGAGQ